MKLYGWHILFRPSPTVILGCSYHHCPRLKRLLPSHNPGKLEDWHLYLLRPAMLCLLSATLAAPAVHAADPDFFSNDVAPILERHCVHCHQGAKAKGGLDLSREKSALAGGESGPAIVGGKPDKSLLVEYISGDKPEMPKGQPPLAAAEVVAIRRWIAEGATWPLDVVLTYKKQIDSNWWSLGRLVKVEVPKTTSPWIRTPVDAFIAAKLDEQHLTPSAEANRRTLIRRLTFDLYGLPPTPQEIDAFLADTSDDAYATLVDRLLASPRYGERFGRYWLDVVHFGESHGYDKDKPRPNAWPYRDYVINSLNQDKPYDRFVEEQIAGDVMYPEDPQATVATGFIAAGPWDFVGHVELREGTVDKDIARANDRDDMVTGVMSTFASLTVHCARCHDHKFDPIRQQDYYGLQAVFAGVERADRLYGANPDIERQRAALTAERTKIESQVAAVKKTIAEKIATESTENTEKAAQELSEAGQSLQQVNEKLASLPKQHWVFAAASQFAAQGSFAASPVPRPIHLLARGDVRSPQQLVAPGGVACVYGPQFTLADPDQESQRRAALAHWLSSRDNALVRRSIVNRVWQFHFGQGIVDTPSDFGRMGSLPTHPELLEWLAGWFIDNGHSLKKLHRLLLTSATYRQSSHARPDAARLDGSNRYLWRANRQRLDAECIRDSLLAVSGKLDLTAGGPSVQQFFFKDDHSPIYDYERFDVDDARSFRRSVYRFLVRSVPDPFMECLDCADPSILTPKRNTTLTSIQALAQWNNPFVTRQAEHFAARLQAQSSDPSIQIDTAYRLAFGRSPTTKESAALLRYIETHNLSNACRLLFNTNEFVFID